MKKRTQALFYIGLACLFIPWLFGCSIADHPLTDPSQAPSNQAIVKAFQDGKLVAAAEVKFVEKVDNTFIYHARELKQLDGVKLKDLSYLAIEVCAIVVEASPKTKEMEGTRVKWDLTDKFEEGYFSITVTGNQGGENGITCFEIKAGREGRGTGCIDKGPECHNQGSGGTP